jgi:hypothetical protein
LAFCIVQGGVAVMLYIFIWEMIGSNVGQVTSYSDRTIRGSPEYLKANAGKGHLASFEILFNSSFINYLTIRR